MSMILPVSNWRSVGDAETVIPFHTTVKPDETVFVREVNAMDGPLLRKGFEQLSDRSRLFRFLSPRNVLTESDLKFFIHENNSDSFAIGALKAGQSGDAPVGIARYVRLQDAQRTAEFALTVVDEYQRRGVGSLLLGSLSKCAVANGIDTFTGHVHRENRGMITLLENLGAQRSANFATDISFSLPLYPDAARYPDTAAGDRFRAAYAISVLKTGAPGQTIS